MWKSIFCLLFLASVVVAEPPFLPTEEPPLFIPQATQPPSPKIKPIVIKEETIKPEQTPIINGKPLIKPDPNAKPPVPVFGQGTVPAIPDDGKLPLVQEDGPEVKVQPSPPLVGKELDLKPKAVEPKVFTEPKAIPVTAAGDDEIAVIPLSFVKNRLENMKTGTMAYIGIEALKVDGKRRCFLDPGYIFGNAGASRPIAIRRDSSGFHVSLEGVEHQWNAVDLSQIVNWIPVRTVTVK